MFKLNHKFALARPDGYNEIRVFHQKRTREKEQRFLLKCGCCEKEFEIYYEGDSLEISGVIGSVENWRELLLPLLNMQIPGQKPADTHSANKRAERRVDRTTGKFLSAFRAIKQLYTKW